MKTTNEIWRDILITFKGFKNNWLLSIKNLPHKNKILIQWNFRLPICLQWSTNFKKVWAKVNKNLKWSVRKTLLFFTKSKTWIKIWIPKTYNSLISIKCTTKQSKMNFFLKKCLESKNPSINCLKNKAVR